jgi:hypothetical protein
MLQRLTIATLLVLLMAAAGFTPTVRAQETAGDPRRHWTVIILQGTKAIEADIPSKVSDQPSQ